MFENFSKRISAIFERHSKDFAEMNEIMDEAFKEADAARLTMSSRKKDGDVIESETVVEEVKPDGTKVTTRTIVRTSRSP